MVMSFAVRLLRTKTIRKVVDEEKEEKEVVKRDFLAFNSRLTM